MVHSQPISTSISVASNLTENNTTVAEHLRIIDTQIGQFLNDREAIDSKIRSLKSRRNAYQLISRLPTDILLSIFLILSRLENLYSESGSRWDWLILTKVCRHWRTSALEYSSLWTELRYFRGLEKVQTFLDRSKGAQLAISLGSGEGNSNICDELIELIAVHMGRAKEFTATFGMDHKPWKCVKSLLRKHEMLHLKKLHLHVNAPNSSQWPCVRFSSSKFSIKCSSLQDVSLKGISLQWNNPIFHGLTVLKIEKLGVIDHQPNLYELLGMLEASPNLEKITLDHVGPKPSPNNEMRSVSLPLLTRFNISGVDIDICTDLFRCLTVPDGVEWSIQCRNYRFQNPTPLIPKLLEHNGSCDHVYISLDDVNLTLESKPDIDDNSLPTIRVALQWSSGFANEVVNAVFTSLEVLLGQHYWVNATKISLDISKMKHASTLLLVQRTAWSHFLRSLSKIHVLYIRLPQDHDVRLDEALVAAMTEADLTGQLWSPDLSAIDLTFANFSLEKGQKVYQKFLSHMQKRKDLGKHFDSVSFNFCNGIGEKEIEELRKLDVVDVIDFFIN